MKALRSELTAINRFSVNNNLEYAGNILPYGLEFGISQGTPTSVTIYVNPNAVAIWHTHAANDPKYDGERFSGTDIDCAKSVGIPSILLTPTNRLLVYDPKSHTTYVVTGDLYLTHLVWLPSLVALLVGLLLGLVVRRLQHQRRPQKQFITNTTEKYHILSRFKK